MHKLKSKLHQHQIPSCQGSLQKWQNKNWTLSEARHLLSFKTQMILHILNDSCGRQCCKSFSISYFNWFFIFWDHFLPFSSENFPLKPLFQHQRSVFILWQDKARNMRKTQIIYFFFAGKRNITTERSILGCALGKPRKDFVKYFCLLVGHTLEETMEQWDIWQKDESH